MATWFQIIYTGEPTEEDYLYAAKLVSEGYFQGELFGGYEGDGQDDEEEQNV